MRKILSLKKKININFFILILKLILHVGSELWLSTLLDFDTDEVLDCF